MKNHYILFLVLFSFLFIGSLNAQDAPPKKDTPTHVCTDACDHSKDMKAHKCKDDCKDGCKMKEHVCTDTYDHSKDMKDHKCTAECNEACKMKDHKCTEDCKHEMKTDDSKAMMNHDKMDKDHVMKAAGNDAIIWNAVCPVKGGEVDPETPTVEYMGKNIGFCCPGCDSKFQADAEKYMKNLSEDGQSFVGKK